MLECDTCMMLFSDEVAGQSTSKQKYSGQHLTECMVGSYS